MRPITLYTLVFVTVLFSILLGRQSYGADLGYLKGSDGYKVNYQTVLPSSNGRDAINVDLINGTTPVTRVVAQRSTPSLVNMSGQVTVAQGYRTGSLGVGVDLLKSQLLGFDLLVNDAGRPWVFWYYGLRYDNYVFRGFVDVKEDIYGRSRFSYRYKAVDVGYELEFRNDRVHHWGVVSTRF